MWPAKNDVELSGVTLAVGKRASDQAGLGFGTFFKN